MTVTSDTQDVTHDTDGATVDFPIPFYFIDDADIVCDKIDSNGNLVTLSLGTDFTISGSGNRNGGTLSTLAVYPSGFKLHIYREVQITQETQYQQNDPFPAKTTETAFDKLTMICQQLGAKVINAIRYPLAEFSRDGVLPPASARGEMLLGWDADGNQEMVPRPASVGAGDLRYDVFLAGVDFTPGTTTTLPLSRAPISDANCAAFFDGAPQFDFSISGANITFTDGNSPASPTPIPDGISVVRVRTGTTLSVGVPAQQSVTDASVASGAAIDASKLSLLQPGVGASRVSLQSVLRAVFTPEQFSQGATDDAQCIANAMVALNAVGGGILLLQPGKTYNCLSNVGPTDKEFFPAYSNIVVWGYGATLKAGGAGELTNGAPQFDFFASASGYTLKNFALVGVHFDGNGANNLPGVTYCKSAALLVDGGCDSVYVRDCLLENFPGAQPIAIYANQMTSQRVLVEATTFHNVGDGVAGNSTQPDSSAIYSSADYTRVMNCNFIQDVQGKTSTAVELHGSKSCAINNDVYQFGLFCNIAVQAGDQGSMVGCTIDRNRLISVRGGVVAWMQNGYGISDLRITNNTFQMRLPAAGASSAAIFDLSSNIGNQNLVGVSVDGNHIDYIDAPSGAAGDTAVVMVANGKNISVRRNKIRTAVGELVWLNPSGSGTVISDVFIEDNDAYDIGFINGRAIAITNVAGASVSNVHIKRNTVKNVAQTWLINGVTGFGSAGSISALECIGNQWITTGQPYQMNASNTAAQFTIDDKYLAAGVHPRAGSIPSFVGSRLLNEADGRLWSCTASQNAAAWSSYSEGTVSPTWQAYVGDYHRNVSPTVVGSAGSQYTIFGWICTGAGAPGTWQPMHALTGT